MTETNTSPVAIAEQLFRISLGLQKLNKHLERSIGMSLVQWYVLKHLLNMPGTPAGLLAREIGVHPGTLTPLLHRLKRKGYLYLEKDGTDCRKKTVLITRDGRAQLLSTEKHLSKLIENFCPTQRPHNLEKTIEGLLQQKTLLNTNNSAPSAHCS